MSGRATKVYFFSFFYYSAIQRPNRRVNLREIYNTLMDKNVILSHTVHSIAIEKIVAMLN